MDAPCEKFCELVSIVKLWFPWRSESAIVSRDFWMPDQSCKVCYDCDSQFTLLNRRHHCRLCGRIFCGKCTANSVPAASCDLGSYQDPWEKVRVCNYCYDQWEQGIAAPCNGIESPNLDHCRSPSTSTLASTKSIRTGDSSNASFCSEPLLIGSYKLLQQSSFLSPSQLSTMEETMDKEGISESRGNGIVTDIEISSSNQLEFWANRIDDDDEDEYGAYQSDFATNQFFHMNNYPGQVAVDGISTGGSHVVHPEGEVDTTQYFSCSLASHNFETYSPPEGIPHLENKEDECDVGEDGDAPSSLYVSEVIDAEPVDFENNGLLWLPPDPENENDELEGLLFDDDDGNGAGGEWGYLQTSNSFGSGEYRKSGEENRKAMKNAVEGHFRALVAQLLQVENLPIGEDSSKDNWLEIVISLALEVATLLKPDTSTSGGMDPGGYVKVKCIASGKRCDSMVIKGVVCKKNVAHRRMTSKIDKARILILGGALEYQRVTNHLSSFHTLLQQEMDHLQMAVAKIAVHHPNVLLVEMSVSRFAQEYLLEKDISLVLNVKRPLLERVARCTGAQIVPSIDNLLSQKLGYCETFHLERFVEDLSPAGPDGKRALKTLMYFEGCLKPFGCTILLRGASGDELKKVKHVLQYAVFAAYHLALETSFLADEGACLPELSLDSSIAASLPGKPLGMERSISTVPGFNIPGSVKSQGPQPGTEPQRSFSVLVTVAPVSDSSLPSSDLPNATQLLVSDSYHRMLSTTTEMNEKTDLIKGNGLVQETTPLNGASTIGNHLSNEVFRFRDGTEQNALAKNPKNEQSVTIGNGLCKLSSPECGKNNSNGSGFLKEEQLPDKEEFCLSLSDHQSILVSLSSRCVWKGTVCEMAHLFRIKYYGTFDKPLGRFLRDHLFDQGYKCGSCDMPSEAHVHCYTHRQGTLTISVMKLSEVLLPGEKEGKIWMWHRCLRCPRLDGFPPATQRIIMSDAAWCLSFGKFLELSFSNHAAASRVASCGHSLHRDCLRFYGFGNMVACFRYASIDVHSVYLPRPELEFNHEREWIQKEKDEVIDQAELLFSEVVNALRQISDKKYYSVPQNGSAKTAEFRCHVVELEAILQQEKTEFEVALQKILSKDSQEGEPAIDILDVNRLRRQLLFQSYMWDHRLVYAATLDKYNCHDGMSNSISENKEISVKTQNIETGSQLTGSIPKRDSSNFESFLMDSDLCKIPDLRGDIDGDILEDNLVKEQYDLVRDGSNRKDGQPNLSLDISMSLPSTPLEPGLPMRRAFSDSEYSSMLNLSDTLDAKWIGDNLPVTEARNNATSAAPDHVVDDAITITQRATCRKEELAEYLNDPKIVVPASPITLNKNQTSAEDSSSLLRMPFLNFYRLLNNNFFAGSQKFDIGYDPVYISSFRELELQSGARLLLPIGINDTVIPVYDDEPSSIICYALMSPHYHHQMTDGWERIRDEDDGISSAYFSDTAKSQSVYSADESFDLQRGVNFAEDLMSYMSATRSSLMSDPVSHTKATHARVSFGDDGPRGKAKYSVIFYYAKQFEALRRVCCPSELDFIRSLSRCKKWGAQGGKSNVFFAKTLDDRFILKQVTKTELDSFIKFAPEYFKYLSESISSRSPTCLAKILGIYQVTSKQLKGGKELRMDVLVMENLLYQRNVSRLYDLKGSARSRYNPDSSGSNKVLLDQNLIESMPTSPIFVGNKAKRLLERAVWNDTAFLASIDVMDYSLLVGVDQEKQQLVVGIIDFMRQYTWDKHLETWVKASGILGGPKNASPTVISPKQYKRRFRKAMTTYFLMVPDQWTPPSIVPSVSQSDLAEDNTHATGTLVE